MLNNNLIILLILFVLILLYLCFKIKNNIKEEFVVKNIEYKVKPINTPFSTIFNIDEQCNSNNKRNLGWKCWWRDNQSDFNVSKDDSFKNTSFTNYLKNTPIKYDGIFEL